jgi:hypothetical protein
MFLVITSPQEWLTFLRQVQVGPTPKGRKQPPPAKEGTLVDPAPNINWQQEIIIAATARPGRGIRILALQRDDVVVQVTLDLSKGGPYHLIRVPRERLMRGPATFVFVDTDGQPVSQMRAIL